MNQIADRQNWATSLPTVVWVAVIAASVFAVLLATAGALTVGFVLAWRKANEPDRPTAPSTHEKDEQTFFAAERAREQTGPIIADHFEIHLASAEVDYVAGEDFRGRASISKDKALIFRFNVVNTDDRRIVRYRPRSFRRSNFVVHDDVGNQIRGVTYGFGTTVSGALTDQDDILPGESSEHVLAFMVPPPATEHLRVSVDLAAFGERGTGTFVIPMSQVRTGDHDLDAIRRELSNAIRRVVQLKVESDDLLGQAESADEDSLLAIADRLEVISQQIRDASKGDWWESVPSEFEEVLFAQVVEEILPTLTPEERVALEEFVEQDSARGAAW